MPKEQLTIHQDRNLDQGFRSSDEVERDLLSAMGRMVDGVKKMAQVQPSQQFHAVEKSLHPGVFELGRLLLLLYLTLREECLSETLPEKLKKHGRIYTRRPRIPRTLGTFFGQLRYHRTYMHTEGRNGNGGHGFHPLDVALGLTSDRFSLHLLSLGCRLAVEMSFESTVTWLERFLGWSPATETIEQAVLGLGVYTQAFFEKMPSLLLGDGEVLVVLIDQKAVPTARAAELRKRRGKRRPNPHPESARHRGRDKRHRLGPKPRPRSSFCESPLLSAPPALVFASIARGTWRRPP